ncbi:MAG: prolipoprotein diacylglyceryl transferase [Lentisphaeria bacterium]
MTDPIAFEIGPLTVRWYGVFTACAFAVGYALVKFRTRNRQISAELIDQLVLWIMVGAVGGARIMYVATRADEFQGRWLEALKIWHGGLVFYGGLIGAVLAVYIAASVKKVDKRALADLLTPALPLGHAIGRIGCFLNGCCFGKPYEGPLAVQYLPNSGVTFIQHQLGQLPITTDQGLSVFPVQLLNSFSNLLIFSLLLVLESRLPRRGQLFAVYLMFYSVFRFMTEFLRGDYLHKTAGFTPAQTLCLILLPVGVAVFWAFNKWTHTAPEKRS